MLKLTGFAPIRRYRANLARLNKYPGLSVIILWPLALIFSLSFATDLLLDAHTLHEAYVASKAWPSTTGNMVSTSLSSECLFKRTSPSNPESDCLGNWKRPSKLEFKYTYTVNGQSYTSDRISFSRVALGSDEDGRLLMMDPHFPNSQFNRHPTVYYNPDMPSRSVLVRGFYGYAAFFSSAMFALNLFLLAFLARKWYQRKSIKFRWMRAYIRRSRKADSGKTG